MSELLLYVNLVISIIKLIIVGRVLITNRLRGIRNAWHFYYALVLVVKLVCSDLGIALLTP
ncbi:DUF3265 domain-containing protein [Vibrio parahaemolyticus]|nr:DUF3265 domain-containing protein [Vibrio alginolyticus]EHK0751978.1 DUF3265 domain-containing protein [Vibrio parahaemolyticus]EGR2323504.1 DUF3265 domain-containing protein [Vibrio alginolyticus]EJB8572672.1 DUF3265 domain-containing protein [Vibrio parahaemolyticus]EJE4178978.1 DUF3265 domain-containing protein [Vibrio parahaemolyticus]